MVARWAHNPKVVGSNPTPAIFFMHSILIVLGSKDRSMMKKRVEFARLYSSRFDYDSVVFSGGMGEADYMKDLWTGDCRVLLEKSSTTTLENLQFTKNLIGKPDRITIITDMSHFLRTKYLAKRVFPDTIIEVVGTPVPVWYMLSKIYYEFSRWFRHAFQ